MRLRIVRLLTICTLIWQAAAGVSTEEPKQVSLVQLLAAPEKFHGKRVSVCGFYRLELECSAIFLSRDDSEFLIVRNAVWIGAAAQGKEKLNFKALNEMFVRVQGTFRFEKKGGGHRNLFPGEINEIELIAELPRASR